MPCYGYFLPSYAKIGPNMSRYVKVWPDMDKLWSGKPRNGQIIFNYAKIWPSDAKI